MNLMQINGIDMPVEGNEHLIPDCDSITIVEHLRVSDLVCGADNWDPNDSAICIYNTKTKEIVYSENLKDKEEFDARMKKIEDAGIKIIREGK